MDTAEIIVLCLNFIFLIPTLASITRFDQWWVRGFDFPRIQISVCIVITLILCAFFYDFSETWHYVATVLLFLSLIYQAIKIFPYTVLSKKQVIKFKGKAEDATISILVSNVLTPNKHPEKLVALVKKRQPDILLTLESDKRWEKALEEIEDDYKYTVKVPLDNLYGMHLYSKLELIDADVHYLVQEDIPSIHGYVKLRNGTKLKMHCLHPMPPSPTESYTSTNRDAEILMLGRDLSPEDRKVLVFGDLNDVAWSRTTKLFQQMSGLMDPRIGRGFFNTFHAGYRLFRWPLDHVFHSKDFTLIEIAREKSIGSDHFPMYIKLNYDPRATAVQEELELEREDELWAQEKIEEAQPLEKSINIPKKIR
ncbi:endonuclease/exonuclease/phosphatase family protein [Zunongwangia sp. SCSIO 43204]|uniref:endonuclease/exonuclease/phosphatase family protein n=1 Tax=Zunongwangia sp. SCSIO 43204 TaxID=2779359 RepID=UPI001CA96E2A|nr:endonuclease/exonuclease/phosphatase family protein [Zunongwangia sp. SCSIO 43204]UAB83794.1 endonuclease/exonuclease/phosphatase family protein [Zunongwangia sp. SCSIO 43204]